LAMADDRETVAELRQLVDQFVQERNWAQFHNPKNLSMALAIEAAELMEHFQWLDLDESRAVADDAERLAAVAEELADVVCYALALANELKLDVADSVRSKMIKNARKYPTAEFRGRWGAGDGRTPEA
jgi:NTP pyrophosphatase (non-canonical NTP hydrolase)